MPLGEERNNGEFMFRVCTDERGVEFGVHYPPFTVYKFFGFDISQQIKIMILNDSEEDDFPSMAKTIEEIIA